MKIKIVVHEAEEGGFWAEVPAIPGCATQGDSMDELMRNLHEAIEGCLSIEVAPPEPGGTERMLELPALNRFPAATSPVSSSVVVGPCSASVAATICMARMEASYGYQFRFTATNR